MVVIFFLSEDWDVGVRGFTRRPLIRAISRVLLGDGAHVLCIERPVSPLVEPWKNPRKLMRWLSRQQLLRSETPNLHIYTPWAPYHERIALAVPGGVVLNRLVIRRQVLRQLRVLNLTALPVVTWIFHPYHQHLLGTISAQLTVYECHDDYGAGFDINSRVPPALSRMEERLARSVDIIFTTAQQLQESRGRWNDNTYLVPNGVDFELFNSALCRWQSPPADIRNIQRPRIIFIGGVTHWIDFALLSDVAQMAPSWNFLFVGPVDTRMATDARLEFNKLHDNPKFHFLGAKPPEEVPAYVAHSDVCIIPYVKRPKTASVYPLKLNEYLAAGKPVVSTHFSRDLDEFKGIVDFVNNARQFVACTERALRSPQTARIQRGIEVARANSWTARATEIISIIRMKLSESAATRGQENE